MRSLVSRIRQFSRREDGLVMTEFLILLPLLIWAFLALFVYWESFRAINMAQKANYAVSDLISRQSDIDMNFVNGMQKSMEYLTGGAPVRMRITSFQWDATKNEYYVLFSKSPNNAAPALTKTDLAAMASERIPVMADRDSAVLVETEVGFTPTFFVLSNPDKTLGLFGLGTESSYMFDNFVITRPRYARRVCLIEQPCPATL